MWVARDKDGTLWLYIDEPRRSSIFSKWEVDTEKSLLRADDCMEIDGDLFQELKWEDEPIEVELTRKNSNETKKLNDMEGNKTKTKYIIVTNDDIFPKMYDSLEDAERKRQGLIRYFNITPNKTEIIKIEVTI